MANQIITKLLQAITEGAKVLRVNKSMYVVAPRETRQRRRRGRKKMGRPKGS